MENDMASKSNLAEVEKGRWEVAIPLPYYGLRKQCKCGAKFWTIRGYHGHYAFVHIYAGVGV